MKSADGTIFFKEWLPDQPELGNPGLLEASRALPLYGTYRNFRPLLGRGASGIAANINSAFRAVGITAGAGGDWVLAGTETRLYRAQGSSAAFTVNSATITSANKWQFAQLDDIVIAAPGGGSVPFAWTVGSAAGAVTLASSGTCPPSREVGVIGQFVMLSDATQENLVRWSSIGNPRDFPTPGSASAVASQSGEQLLPPDTGFVRAIVGGDQYGLIFCSGGIYRVTYVGGDVVFQFDQISKGIGLAYPGSAVRLGGITYFLTNTGVFSCDGVQIRSIGEGKVNKWFKETAIDEIGNQQFTSNVDWQKNLIFWSFPSTAGAATNLLIYNPVEERFSMAPQTCRALVSGGSAHLATYGHEAITDGNEIGEFNGTVGSAVFTTGEVEWSPGSYSRALGVKPLVDATVNAVTVAIGTRNNRTDAVSYTAETTANSRSGFCDFRSEARYHRARMTVTGTFNAAQGLEFQVAPSGPV